MMVPGGLRPPGPPLLAGLRPAAPLERFENSYNSGSWCRGGSAHADPSCWLAFGRQEIIGSGGAPAPRTPPL